MQIFSFTKEEFREWLLENNSKAKECFVKISRSKDCPKGCLNYLDAAFKNVKEFYIDEDIQAAFENNKIAYYNFKKMPILYQKVRIDTIQRYKKNRETFERRLKKLIDNCEKNILFGEWNDNGKLIE